MFFIDVGVGLARELSMALALDLAFIPFLVHRLRVLLISRHLADSKS